MKAWRSIFTRFFLYNLKVRHSGVHAVIVHRMPLEPQNPKVIFSQQSSEWRSPSSTNDINVIILALFLWISVQSYLTKVRTPGENVLCREIWQWSRLNSLSEENYKFWEITSKSWWKKHTLKLRNTEMFYRFMFFCLARGDNEEVSKGVMVFGHK